MPGSAEATQKAIIFIQNLMNCQLKFWGQHTTKLLLEQNHQLQFQSLFIYVSKIEWVEL